MLIIDKLGNTRCLEQEIKITNSPTPRDNQYLYRVSFMLIVSVCVCGYIYIYFFTEFKNVWFLLFLTQV